MLLLLSLILHNRFYGNVRKYGTPTFSKPAISHNATATRAYPENRGSCDVYSRTLILPGGNLSMSRLASRLHFSAGATSNLAPLPSTADLPSSPCLPPPNLVLNAVRIM